MPRRNVHAPIVILVLTCGVLLSASINRGTSDESDSAAHVPPLETAEFSVAKARGLLQIGGTSSSANHEASLIKLAADQFTGYETQTLFRPGILVGEHWEPATTRLLSALAAMDSAEAALDRQSVTIRGVTSDVDKFAARVEFLRQALPQDVQLSTDILVVRSAASFDELCEKSFLEIVFEPVSFRLSSVEIRQRSFVTLDRITDFAHDCQEATIVITGHTDASGNETLNQQLSLDRAQAVADQIALRGINPQRLVVKGLGSAVPVADNSTALGRELNRRIEFELR